jgi:hypothetical protein
MSDWSAGFAIGIAVGLAIGLITGRRQKPLDELSEQEKKRIKILIGIGVVALIAGLIVFFLVS